MSMERKNDLFDENLKREIQSARERGRRYREEEKKKRSILPFVIGGLFLLAVLLRMQ